MRVLIVGGGKVGTYLAERLLREKHDVRLIELREEEKDRVAGDPELGADLAGRRCHRAAGARAAV